MVGTAPAAEAHGAFLGALGSGWQLIQWEGVRVVAVSETALERHRVKVQGGYAHVWRAQVHVLAG